MSLLRALPLLLLLSPLALGACTRNTTPQQAPPEEMRTITHRNEPITTPDPVAKKLPTRIILMIGDGMGLPAVSAATYVKGEPLQMLQMPQHALMRTHEHEFMTTDSAASATAFATGAKTHFEGVSVTPGTSAAEETLPERHLETTSAVAARAGWRSGLVATSRIVHATPAAFGSHRANRGSYEEIALDMAASSVDVMLGAGSTFFTKRKDGRDLLKEMSQREYMIADSPQALDAARQSDTFHKVVGLLHDKDMPPISAAQTTPRAMSLAQLTQGAIELLDKEQPQGFFLMVEGSFIDWEEHEMNAVGAVAETLDFDEAVAAAREYAASRDDVLVIVTADHETGGLALLDPPSAASALETLGGEEAATRSVAAADPALFAPPVQQLPLGGSDSPATLGPWLAADKRLLTSFGYLSVQSRKGWKEKEFFSATHTATMVPLFAQGKGAELVSKVHDNADLGRLIRALILQSAELPLTDAEKALIAPLTAEPAPQPAATAPKNVILLVGDGMGVASITATQYARGELAMMQLPVTGLVATHGADRLVNDSAATATALSTGYHALYKSVGMRPDASGVGVATPSVLELAEQRGLRTGLVTTTTLTHATPAAFYAHHMNRSKEGEIASFFVDLPSRIPGADGIDFAAGGGGSYFGPAQREALAARGVIIERGTPKTPAAPDSQVVRFLADKGLDTATERLSGKSAQPALAQLTQDALAHLDGAPKGFFLLVEGGQIDWAEHELERGPRLIDEVDDFDRAVAAALDYARAHQDTLVIVTADHDHTLSVLDNHYGFSKGQCGAAKRCGGTFAFEEIALAPSARLPRAEGFEASALQGGSGAPKIMLQYAWVVQAAAQKSGKKSGPHSASFVPLFAYGPGAERFGGFHQQPEIGALLTAWASGQAP